MTQKPRHVQPYTPTPPKNLRKFVHGKLHRVIDAEGKPLDYPGQKRIVLNSAMTLAFAQALVGRIA
ncbi:hypothetical protein I6G56_08695 [Burkholderia humptydooensis]|uniref:Uncharacterized protein n=1 Tax=Burkholderia humptydooensis TaxID=430531 RepID=A0A7U4SRV5_9BURK|nr:MULTISPECIES: hypothetical protein [Burkholderia]AJY44297.1 hypothetical protein BW21_2456 [Burkholderia sp. 2002721687]ALX42996.1 hypothetical protein AQ610_11620 [Burkholderia humptydooensis]QPS45114.1 hypothetical protein I6G56_08695 [Burkholderia humptydooensis]